MAKKPCHKAQVWKAVSDVHIYAQKYKHSKKKVLHMVLCIFIIFKANVVRMPETLK